MWTRFRIPRGFTREKGRGKRALRNATVFVCRLLAEAYRLAALCFGVFLTMRGRAFREGNLAGATRSTGELKPRRTFLSRQPSSRQAVLVPPGGAPTPPRCLAANQARRRRPFPATRTPLDAPSMETTKRNIVLDIGKSQQERFPLMAGRRPGHPRLYCAELFKGVDARHKAGHDECMDSGSALRAVRNDAWGGSSPRMRERYWPGHALELIRRPGIRGARISGTVSDLADDDPGSAAHRCALHRVRDDDERAEMLLRRGWPGQARP
jgi:hypothetical protein